MEVKVSYFIRSLNISDETASIISSKFTSEDNLVAHLSNPTIEKHPIPALTPLACWTFRLLLGTNNVQYSSTDKSLIAVNWSEAYRLEAQCVISPSSTEEMSLIMKIISFLHVPFAVRSGGHSPNPNWSSIDLSGILISTTNLDSITVSLDNSVASIGPGLRWGAVYEALDLYGVSMIGGRIPQVGVGGLILGGDLSHFSAQYGLAVDNVVLTSGEIVDANADTNSDLFWALKGGGPNFGIVTRFDMYTIPVRNVWFQATAYPLTELPKVLAAFTEWPKNGAQTDSKSSVLINILNTGCSLGLVYSECSTYPEAFALFATIPNGFVRVPPTNATVTFLSTILGGAFSNASSRHVYRSAASLIDEKLYNETSSYFLDTINRLQADGIKVNMTFTLQTIPQSLVAASEARGRWTTVTDWVSAADDETVLGAVKSIADQFEIVGASRGSNLPYLYMNDCYADQNPLAQYPTTNIRTLKEIAAKYDPTEVFQLLQKDGFLLSKL